MPRVEKSMNMRSLLVIAATAIAGTTVVGQEAKYRAPRNEVGRPDLQGVWNFSSDVPLERPAAFADKKFFTRDEVLRQRAGKTNALESVARFAPVEAIALTWLDYDAQVENLRTSLITYPEDGRLPKLVEGVRRTPGIEDFIAALNSAGGIPPALLAGFGGGTKDGPEDLPPAERCLGGSGTPLRPGFDNNYLQIVQSRDWVAFVREEPNYARIAPLDQRPHLGQKLRSWHGDSRGRWEGDTLVVETRNFNNRTESFAGAGRSLEKVVTERFTRTSSNVIEYEATIVDPKTFQDKIVISLPLGRKDARLYEVACHEGNYSLPMTLAGARKDEAAGPVVRRQQITLLDRNGQAVRTIGDPGAYTQAAFSPDGTRIAVIRTDLDTQGTGVWVYDVATGKGTAITSDNARHASPVWSPDGRQIAYVSAAADNEQTIFRKASDGSGREEPVYTHIADSVVLTDWSTDGILCFWSGKVLYAVPLNGDRKAVALSDNMFNVRGGRFSPDGRLIAFNSDESGRFQVYVRPFTLSAGSVSSSTVKSIPVSDGQAIGGIFFRQDGKEIYFLASPQQAVMAADVTMSPAIAVAKPRLLFRVPAGFPAPAQLSNVATGDGQRFVYLAQITIPQSTVSASAPK
jgi:WD40 repeat protein